MKYKNAVLLLGLSLILPWLVHAADVTITVNGSVVARPCQTPPGDTTVDFGDIYTTSLNTAGSVTAWKDITLALSGCPVGTSTVNVVFTGLAASNADYYANSSIAGSAGGIELELQDSANGLLKNGASRDIPVDFNTGTAELPVKVRVRSESGIPTEGNIEAVINVTYTYL
ncbi:fimbrial protein [Serratia fonticola]|uniref:fimbrial protein n=1 Tax=Serratia fonticola TaxID=47917 RepID=UPI00040C1D22|nr:fimbrial protein [Serratia fonticola]